MKLTHGLHLAYCTNIHRGESWPETFENLCRYTLAVRERVCPNRPYAVGLRLSDLASRQLAEPGALKDFRNWLDRHRCYVFTINGFPFGQFHGSRVKEQVYAPDWTNPKRVTYTNRLFDLLAVLVPDGVEGSVSTVPCSYKEFIKSDEQAAQMRANLWQTIEHVAKLSERSGKCLHLGLEPEPLCYVETSAETVAFIERLRADRPTDPRAAQFLGVNYDTCHLAIEFEDPREAIERFRRAQVRVSKLHLSSALRVQPAPGTREALRAFADDVYFHQVIERRADGSLRCYRDLDVALESPAETKDDREWRIHFHIPLHSPPTKVWGNTTNHLLGVLDLLRETPSLCSHLEMETYTWEVMPPELKARDVVSQLAAEYEWTLRQLAERGIQQEP